MDPWVVREWGLAVFGDARLPARVLHLARDVAAHPALSLASLDTSDGASLKAAYRFFDKPKVTPAQRLEPHQAATEERCAAERIILIAQDTPSFKCTRHPATAGMGPEPGFLLHSA